MICNYYNKQFGCGGCCHFVRTNSVEVSGGKLVLDIPQLKVALINRQKVCVCIAQAIPQDMKAEHKVVITIDGGKEYPLMNKLGNNVYGDQIRSRRVYHLGLASDNETFAVSECELCRTNYVFPISETEEVEEKEVKKHERKNG